MGQKVNPIGMRVGVSRGWNTRWFAEGKEYALFLNEDIKIREYLTANLKDAMLSHVDIERKTTDKGEEVVAQVHVGRPGVITGQDDTKRKELIKNLNKIVKTGTVRLDVIDIKQVDLDATLVANWIARELENRASFRTAQKKAIQRVRKAGAKGCRTLVSGRLGGADIARSEGYKEGIIPLHTLRSNIDFGTAEAHTTYGRLGVKVWVCLGNVKTDDEVAVETEAPRAFRRRDRKGDR